MLDPTLARSFVGRIVFAALCDKLFDIDEKLNIVPQLAASHEWSADSKALTIKLRAGRHVPRRREARCCSRQVQPRAPQDDGGFQPARRACAARERRRHRSNDGSPQPVGAVLAAARATRRSRRDDRLAKAAQAAGDKFGAKPVCAGPFKFVERVAQDRIVLERFANYWNKADVHFDRVVFLPIPDSTVRLANLRSGQLDFIERLGASDVPQVKGDARFRLTKITEIGYQGITINLGKSDLAQKNPLGRDPRVREAFELALDRDGIVQVANDGEGDAGNQWVAPTNPFYAKTVPIPARNLARAKALLQEAGVTNPSFTLMTPTTADAQRIAQVVQAMAREAGFDVKIQSTEFATSLDLADKGQFDAYVLAWSGRADPDGNIFSFDACKQPLNYAGYCKPEVDDILNRSRTTRDVAERTKLFGELAAIVLKDRPIVYLYHRHWLWAYASKIEGLRPIPDGLVRVTGVRFK